MPEIKVDIYEATSAFGKLQESINSFPISNEAVYVANTELQTVQDLKDIEQDYSSHLTTYLQALARVERDAWGHIEDLEETDQRLSQHPK